MTTLNLIAAIGRHGELGFSGRLPWHDAEDLRWFAETTAGGVLIMGWRTAYSLPASFNAKGRTLHIWAGSKSTKAPVDFLSDVRAASNGRPIWLCGGAKTYRDFAPFVDRMFISRIDYDGEADTYFPFDAYGMDG